jgi:hypothetical protein
MKRRLIIGFVSAMLVSSVGATSASAAVESVKIGSALNLPMGLPGMVCTNCLSLQVSQVGGNGPLPLTSPANGLVTSWAVRTGDPGALYALKVLRPAGTNTYQGIASVLAPAPVPAGTTDSVLGYPARVAIKQGDAIGVVVSGGTGLPQNTTNGVTTNVIANNFSAQPADGQTAAFIPDQQHELLLQATVEFCRVPSLAGLLRAAAEQAVSNAGCAADATTKKLKRTKKNKKKKGKVLTQSPAANETVAPGTPVDLTVAGLKKKKKR